MIISRRSVLVSASAVALAGAVALPVLTRPAHGQASPATLNAHQQLARDIYKELVEINTTTDADPGGTTQAAEAMALACGPQALPVRTCRS